jgi:hypothetical protein
MAAVLISKNATAVKPDFTIIAVFMVLCLSGLAALRARQGPWWYIIVTSKHHRQSRVANRRHKDVPVWKPWITPPLLKAGASAACVNHASDRAFHAGGRAFHMVLPPACGEEGQAGAFLRPSVQSSRF